MESNYYSPRRYCIDKSAINKLANAEKVKKVTEADWLSRQMVWKIYLPPPKQIHFAHFDVSVRNEVHQADLLFMPHDTINKYALTLVDAASRYEEAKPLLMKAESEILYCI